jgi:hypothetical protein
MDVSADWLVELVLDGTNLSSWSSVQSTREESRTYVSTLRSLFAIFLFSRERVVPVISHGGDVHLWHALAERGYSIRITTLPWRSRSFSNEGVGADYQSNS